MRNILKKSQKEKFLSFIPNITYREVMAYWLDGLSSEEIGIVTGYSTRQIQRIISVCKETVLVELLRECT